MGGGDLDPALKQQLDRIESDGKRCLRILTGDDHPESGLVMKVALAERDIRNTDLRLTNHITSQKTERKGVMKVLIESAKVLAAGIAGYLSAKSQFHK